MGSQLPYGKSQFDMSLLIKTHRPLGKSDFEALWKKGVFIFDTNVLLNLYRLPENARNDFLKILGNASVKDRIWIPFQVALEFLNNRISVISEQKKAFKRLEDALVDCRSSIESAFGDMAEKIGKMQLDKRHSLISPDEFSSRMIVQGSLNGTELRFSLLLIQTR